MGSERSSARLPEQNTTHKAYTWTFKQRFRKGAFGWRSQPAVTRVKEAIAEIVAVAKKDQVIGADGAVLFLERVSPALENVDSSSGAIGSAVHAAIEKLVPIIASAPADLKTREKWLERLFEAHESDQIPYIERLAEFWGELCSTEELANRWADRLIDVTRMALSADRNLRGHFHGSSACLSALYRARRFDEIIDIVSADVIWPYKRWAVKALFAQGKKAEAIRYAEACRSPWASEFEIACLCEEILLSSGLLDEAYDRYGRVANRRGTHLATFRAIAKKYPHKKSREILADLVRDSPGEEGKWFAAAKDAGLYDNAIALAASAPCDPRTLTRASRDFASKQPGFALDAGLLAIHWLARGHGYEITHADVYDAYRCTMTAAGRCGKTEETTARIREIVEAGGAAGRYVLELLGRDLVS